MIDLSSSGLSIRTTLDLAQGDEVAVAIETGAEFRAIAWRTARTRSGFSVGLMLASACSEHEALVARHASRSPAATAATTPAQPSAPSLSLAEPWWRLRVKDEGGNRTRVVAIVAASREQAIDRALAEIGGGWEILEADLAPRAPTSKPERTQSA